jgi:hypothetical protein
MNDTVFAWTMMLVLVVGRKVNDPAIWGVVAICLALGAYRVTPWSIPGLAFIATGVDLANAYSWWQQTGSNPTVQFAFLTSTFMIFIAVSATAYGLGRLYAWSISTPAGPSS